MADIAFWGATGQSKVLFDALHGSVFNLVALIDSQPLQSPIPGVPLMLDENGLDELVAHYGKPSDLFFSVAVGGSRGSDRLSLFDKMRNRGLTPHTIVHRNAFVAADTTIGEACQILALAAVCSSARLGRAVIVNTSASVDHDCKVGEGTHIGPGARLAGEVCIGARAFIGTGAVVLPRIRIGDDVIVGAGAIVTKDVDAGTTVVGNPARLMKTHIQSQ